MLFISMPCSIRTTRRRDRLYRLVIRLLSVALLPLAFVVAPRRARLVACQWALTARFPAENLDDCGRGQENLSQWFLFRQ